MAASKPLVVIGFIGTQVDSGDAPGRWEKWRPTIALGMFEDLLVTRMELLVDQRRFGKLAGRVVSDLKEVSPETEVRLHDFHVDDPWDFEAMYGALHDFSRAYAFDTDREEYLVHITTGTHVAQICWFLLVEARFLPAVLLQTSPPRPQRHGDPGTHARIDLDLARYDRIAQRFAAQRRETAEFLKSGIQTRSPAFNRMIDQIERVAVRSRAPMLLLGPTGAGKSQLARNLFELKRQRHALKGRFVEVNCATLRGDGAGSALFGHVRGAYTGAQSERVGFLKGADQGLLFLDEIGELGIDEQAMLLGAIEERRFLPLGGDAEVSSDFQLVAGTNRDLAVAVAQGRFREDLYARLNLWTFHLPALSERREDIEPNLDYELERWASRHGERVTFNKEARTAYLKFATAADAPWPGNFRDLGASVTRMATLAHARRVTLDVVQEEIQRLRRLWGAGAARPVQPGEALLAELFGAKLSTVDRFDRAQLAEVVRVCRDSRTLSEAGRMLFHASRAKKASSNDADRLRKYLARFDLDFESVRGLRDA
jgi:transcriptional regulatory protein RtcR